MSSCSKTDEAARETKRQRAETSDDDDEVQVTKVVAPPRPNLEQVYIAFSCNYPLQNDKWGESSGHETEDTQCLGVFASLKDANAHARAETYLDEDESDEDNDDDESEDTDPFYWQEEELTEWTTRRVWVEVQEVNY